MLDQRERPSIRDHVLKYVHALIDFEAQISLCNARHGIDQRVARWLLLARERIGGDLVPVTRSHIASALGVRRPGVSKIVADLELQEIVEGSRCAVRIVDIDRLRPRLRMLSHRQAGIRIFRDLPHHRHLVGVREVNFHAPA